LNEKWYSKKNRQRHTQEVVGRKSSFQKGVILNRESPTHKVGGGFNSKGRRTQQNTLPEKGEKNVGITLCRVR